MRVRTLTGLACRKSGNENEYRNHVCRSLAASEFHLMEEDSKTTLMTNAEGETMNKTRKAMKSNLRRWLLVASAMGMVFAWSITAHAHWYNQCYKNSTGQTAYDLTKIVTTNAAVTEAMKNHPFEKYVILSFGPRPWTFIHWYDGHVPPNGLASGCFVTEATEIEVLGAWWTDSLGRFIGMAEKLPTVRILERPGGVAMAQIGHVAVDWTGAGFPPEPGDGPGDPLGPIEVTELNWAVIDRELPPEMLNDSLWGPFSHIIWQPLGDLLLSYGDSTVFDLGPQTPGNTILVRVNLANDGGYEVVQYRMRGGDIPTLTEWGLIIFAVLLSAWMAWMFLRRRRRVTVSIP